LSIAAVLVAVAAAAGPAAAPAGHGRLESVRTWAFAIGNGDLGGDLRSRYAPYDLVVVDGEAAAAGQVSLLRGEGKVVLAYLDVGTIERGRWWFRAARPYRLDYWPDWGEWYANLAPPGYRRLLVQRVAPAILRKGFDGLFLDNTDMVESHPKQRAGMRMLVRQLASLVHRRGGFLFTQNGDASIGATLRYYDGWNREDVTWTYDFDRHSYVRQSASVTVRAQDALRRIRRAGLLVLATDYVVAGDTRAEREAVANACAAGAVPFVSDIDLTRVPQSPPRCGTRTAYGRGPMPPALAVDGNRLVDARGDAVRLLGVDLSGAEYACIQNFGFFDTPTDDRQIALIASWRVNAVRVPLNEDCWLGIHAPRRYSGRAYRAKIHELVTRLHRHGLYVILDLHWNAPGREQATGLRRLADADHSPAFWRSVASSFRRDHALLFDLYNEPHDVSWRCWRDGCLLRGPYREADDREPRSFHAAGMQRLVDAVRSTGATQPLLLGGNAWANDLSGWLRYLPHDRLRQLVRACMSTTSPSAPTSPAGTARSPQSARSTRS
jgi:uncharacterized protein (TIGR01370 family)